MSFVDEVVAREIAKAQAHRYSMLLDEQGTKVQQANPNAGIPQQYTQQSQPQQGGLMEADSLAPMRAFREMYGRQGSPAQMQQNRQNYQGQYGSAESLAPMQALNQYRQGSQSAAGTAPSGQPVSFGGK